MTLIDLGEPSRYDPGRRPPLREALRESLHKHDPVRVGRAALAALMMLLAGLVAGTAPVGKPLPALHRVGRFAESPWRFAKADVVLNATADGQTMVASGLDGSGEKWRLNIGNVGPIHVIADFDYVVVIAGGMRLVDEDTSTYTTSFVAVDVRTGREVWRRDEEPVFGAGNLLVLRTPPGRLSGVEVETGRVVWRIDLPKLRMMKPLGEEDFREFVVLQSDGTVDVVSIPTGAIEQSWRVREPPEAISFVWRDLVGLQYGTTAGVQVWVYRHGDAEPLWRRDFGRTEFVFGVCGEWLCDQNGLVDPYSGKTVTPSQEPATPPKFGDWEPIGEYAGHQLVRLDSASSADAQMWLGVVGPGQRVRPLMPLGGRANRCMLIGNWLYCDGSAVVDAVSVRLSDLDGLLAEVGGPA
ncbi:MAG: PQQ-binding-like beta-propeller repeat protein [Hamadaea sp.]|uniref:outer membrane protein assembly factor BamB family protein n=1 Tax=Hamadaea sp. TaxID=2024425 RepID=UPI0017C5510D|nr:PQQ-binding-like beta-propeller repeat protein [Hamadaea sp.]NUR74391.1 PQQ-binding-like beta-propeller repeat protein [Hamadaea sp.]NUT22941.1 PQQ-binding-like beta-propeller repeat protein [Hamadaea sp.]